jgi:hypothetical protein
MPAHPPPGPDLQAAFLAAWGAPSPITRPIGHCCESGWELSPRALIPLGGGKAALIVKESRERGAHASPGAVAVAYLRRENGHWRVLGNWPEVAWAGQSGGDNLTFVVRRDLGRDPILLVNGFYFGQSQLSASSVLVRLGPEKPTAIGRIPTAGDNTTGHFISVGSYKYASRIVSARAPALAVVHYSGFTGPPGKPARTPFRVEARIVLRDGCAVPTASVSLPDEPWTGSDPEDCSAPVARQTRAAKR